MRTPLRRAEVAEGKDTPGRRRVLTSGNLIGNSKLVERIQKGGSGSPLGPLETKGRFESVLARS